MFHFMKTRTTIFALLASLIMIPASMAATTSSVDTHANTKSGYDIEIEYLHHMHFKDRSINTYNVHLLKYAGTTHIGKIHDIDWYRGVTISRPVGSLVENDVKQDSDAVGLGYTFLLRKERKWGPHFAAALDASGGLMLYNNAFPATGRAYNFMWRIGPRIMYHITDCNSIFLGWTYMHVSNGWGTKNPSYNAGGITLGFNRIF